MYQEQQFNLQEMKGLSKRQIDAHLGLYSGYVKNVNLLDEKLKQTSDGYTQAELRRRWAFEWNGMRLHELYFEALGSTTSGGEEEVRKLLEQQFGSYENWESDFKQAGMMRGIGWVILSLDKKSGKLSNIWVGDHELGHLAGTEVLIAMDVWEHAFLLDYLPSERKNYIEAYFSNLNWGTISERILRV